MVEEKEWSKTKFHGLVERFCKLKWLTADEADDAKQQFDEFMDTECPKQRKVCQFWQTIWCCWCFRKVCSIICVLSHCQSAVERRFSINKELLVENLQEKSLVSQRMVYDHINSNKINIYEYELPSDLLKSCKLSDRHYNAALEETKKREDWYGSQKTEIDRRGHSSCKEEKRWGNQMCRSFENGCWQVVNRSRGKSKFRSSYKG